MFHKLIDTNCCFLKALFLILFCIRINESYYRQNQNKLKRIKSSEIARTEKMTSWRKPSLDQYIASYYRNRQPKSDTNIFNQGTYSLHNDLQGQKTNQDVLNSIWSGDLNKFNAGNTWATKSVGNTNFKNSVNGLVDNWLYEDYDNYDYQNIHPPQRKNRRSQQQYPYRSVQYLPPYDQGLAVVKADRRSDEINFSGVTEETQNIRAAALERYQPNIEQFNGDPSNDDPRNQYFTPEDFISALELKKDNNQSWKKNKYSNQPNEADDRYREKSSASSVEGKHIISGIDINPLTSNAFMKLTDSDIEDMYTINEIISDVKTGRIKYGLDKAVLGIGDTTIGRKNKQKSKNDLNQLMSGISDNVKNIQDNSINAKLTHNIKVAITGSVKDDRTPKGKKDRNQGPLKLPKMITNLQNKAKRMGKYMLKKAKQMWRTEHRVASTKALIPNGPTERQGLTFIAGLLSGLTAPATSWVSVVLLVVVEVVSMGLQAGLQINQVDPTTTIKPAGLCARD